MRHYKLLQLFTGLFIASLLISNTIADKIITIWPFDVNAAIIIFPLSYLFADVLTEVYGYKNTKKVIWIWFVGLLLMAICYSIAIALPPAAFWWNQDAFATALGNTTRIVIASALWYWCWEFANSFVVSKMKLYQKWKNMGGRFVLSTFVGQIFDTIVFIAVAFAGILPLSALRSMFIWWWVLKTLWEIIALPVTIPVVKYIKKYEKEDYFDNDTNYNPFSK